MPMNAYKEGMLVDLLPLRKPRNDGKSANEGSQQKYMRHLCRPAFSWKPKKWYEKTN
jgi:hypothetical protein